MKIQSLAHAEKVLQAYVPAVAQFTGKSVNLDRMWPLMKALSDPQKKLRVVHIAGTSGKTSTSYYVSALLLASGAKVGLTVSPHIDSVTERIQINGLPISEELFCTYLGEAIDLLQPLSVQPSYFELLMALAYYVFYKEGVDYAVIETGMGGLLDASNVATSQNKVCVITDIGFDHMHILGTTLKAISAQKAGIIHHNNAVFMYKQSHDVMGSVRARIEDKNALMHVVSESMQNTSEPFLAMPLFQRRNWTLAYAAVQYVTKRDNLQVPSKCNLEDTMHTYVPARMETKQIGSKTIVFDGAHNAQKMQTFVQSYVAAHPHQKACIVLAMKQGKEYEDVLDILMPITERLIVTAFRTSQDLPAVAVEPEMLAQKASEKGFTKIKILLDPGTAYEEALKSSENYVIVTGSFYLLAQLRKLH